MFQFEQGAPRLNVVMHNEMLRI